MLIQLVEQHPLLMFVDLFDPAHDRRRHNGFRRSMNQRFHVFGETGAAIARARVDEVVADPRVRADAAAHGFDVRVQPVRQIRQLVHQTDPGRQHHVGGVFGELGAAYVHVHDLVVIAVERRVQRVELARTFAGPEPMTMRSGFMKSAIAAPSFRNSGLDTTSNAISRLASQSFGHRCTDLVRGADRYRRLVDDDFRFSHVLADGARNVSTYLRSADPSSSAGVPTAMKMISP